MYNSIMAQEAAESPTRIAEQLTANAGVVAQVVAQIQARKPRFVYMVGRGSSDHAGVFAKYLIEIELGLPVAAAAMTRSVWRQRNAGIWMISSTSAARSTSATEWTSESTGRL